MSLKNPPVKRTPRAMPVETIITRFKSAQQKKLQEPEQKKVIKNNKKNKITKKAVLQAEKKSTLKQIKDIVENNEFYPNRHKRNIKKKKVVLIPKHCLKMVGGTKSSNKRKLHIPRKEPKHIKYPSSDQIIETDTNISLPELIRVIEENGSLDDEDFLEILTCPSPVWWEDPPHGYMEEALYSRTPERNDKSHSQNEESISENNNYNVANDLVIDVDNRGKNFIKKRGKLETLLKNIRDKINKTESNAFNNIKNNREKKISDSLDDPTLKDDEVLKHLENINIPIEKDKEALEDYDSDKNMSIVEEYLDMSYFEEDFVNNRLNEETTPKRYFKQIQKDKEVNKDKEEYVAVYKIIESDDEINEVVTKNKQINTYYKQKKFQSSVKCSCFKNKSIKVSDSVKYCLICSSINDTDECKYCLGKLKSCVCSQYTCDVCNIRMNDKNKFIQHMNEHKECMK